MPPPELCTDNAAMIASAARWVDPIPYPGYLALDAYATGRRAAPPEPWRTGRAAGRGAASSRGAARVAEPSARPRRRLAIAAASPRVAVVVAALLLAGPGDPPPPALADAVPYDGRSPREPSGAGHARASSRCRGRRSARPGSPTRDDQRALRALARGRVRRAALGARRPRRAALRRRHLHAHVQRLRRDRAHRATSPTCRRSACRAQPVRRFYPATSEPAASPGLRPPVAAAPLGGASIAVLDSRRRRARTRCSRGRLDPGYDAVDRDDDPAPAADPRGGRRETSGTALAGHPRRRGRARAADPRRRPAAGDAGRRAWRTSRSPTSCSPGLERAVDPDGDGATDDHVPVAVVGVNSPYAGFERSPEARGGRAARRTSARSSSRPPAARARPPGRRARSARRPRAPDALAVGALAAPDAVGARSTSRSATPTRAARALLVRRPAARRAETRRADRRDRPGASCSPRRAAACAAGSPSSAPATRRSPRAAAAAAAGARAVLLAEPRGRPLPGDPGGPHRRARPRRDRRGRGGRARRAGGRGRRGRRRRARAARRSRRCRRRRPTAGRRRRRRAAPRRDGRSLSATALSPVLQPRPGRRRRGQARRSPRPGAALTAVPGDAARRRRRHGGRRRARRDRGRAAGRASGRAPRRASCGRR